MTETMCSEKRATDTGLGIQLPADELAGASTGFFKMPHSKKFFFNVNASFKLEHSQGLAIWTGRA